MSKLFAIVSGNVVSRATRTVTTPDNLVDDLAKVVARAPKAEKIEMRDGDKVIKTFKVKDGVAVIKATGSKAAKAPALDADGNPIVRKRGRPAMVDENGNRIAKSFLAKANKKPDHGKATGIVRDLMVSGKPFTREDALNALIAAFPDKDKLALNNIVGVAMHNIAKHDKLVKTVTKVEGSRRKVFTFAAPAVPAENQEVAA